MIQIRFHCFTLCFSVCHLVRVVLPNDVCGPLAEQLSGIGSFVSGGDLFSVPQVQRTASQVQSGDLCAADVSEVILAACQVAWSTSNQI